MHAAPGHYRSYKWSNGLNYSAVLVGTRTTTRRGRCDRGLVDRVVEQMPPRPGPELQRRGIGRRTPVRRRPSRPGHGFDWHEPRGLPTVPEYLPRTSLDRPHAAARQSARRRRPRPHPLSRSTPSAESQLDSGGPLVEPLRLTVVAVDVVGLSYAEAARSLRTRKGTIMSRLLRTAPSNSPPRWRQDQRHDTPSLRSRPRALLVALADSESCAAPVAHAATPEVQTLAVQLLAEGLRSATRCTPCTGAARTSALIPARPVPSHGRRGARPPALGLAGLHDLAGVPAADHECRRDDRHGPRPTRRGRGAVSSRVPLADSATAAPISRSSSACS